MSKRILRYSAVLAVATFVNLFCAAQTASTTGTITGTVTDQAAAVVVGAGLTLTNQSTGLVKTATTNSTGQYVLNFIPVGPYTLQIEKAGFQTQQIAGVQIAAAQGIQLNFSLKISSATQSVVVTSQGPLVSVGTSEERGEVSSAQLNQLPVSNQDWTSLLNLLPGVSTSGGGVILNGLPSTAFGLTVDGTNASQNSESSSYNFYGGPNIINTINNDAIQEISAVRGISPASVGGTMSGNINIISKGGTNTLHGDIYEINEENLYDARNPFLTERPRTTFNQFGGSISGPFIKNKLFYFTSYEGVRYNAFTDVSADVPSPYLISISPAVYQPVFASYPAAQQPPDDPTATTVFLSKSGSNVQKDSDGLIRLDYSQNEHNQYTLRYIRGRPYSNSPNINAINPRVYTAHSDAYNGNWTHSGYTWTSNARAGYNRILLARDDLGLASDYEGVSLNGFNTNGSEAFSTMGGIWTGDEDISWTHGRHTLQTGVVVQRLNTGRIDLNTSSLNYSSLSDFQSNIPSSVEITFDLTPFNISTYQYGAYIQDDYRALPNLTFNLGVRYDYFSVPKEDSGRFFNRGINPLYPQLGPGYGPYLPANSIYNGDFNNFQPRAGFSWGVGPSGKTVVRGGFGIFVNPHSIYGAAVNVVQDNATTPFRITLNRSQALAAGLKYPVHRADYTAILQHLVSSGVVSPNFADSAIRQNYPDAYSVQYTLGIEQALPWETALDIAYVGNRGFKENITEVQDLPNRLTGIAPFPQYSQFNYYFAGDMSNYNGLQVQLNKRLQQGIMFGASYTWSRNMAFENAGLEMENPPQDNNNIKADYGPTIYDMRNNFVFSGVWNLPITHWMGLRGRLSDRLLGGWQISGTLELWDANPVNLVNGNSSYPSDRPDAVLGVNPYIKKYSIFQPQYLNPAAFAMVPISTLSGAQIRGGDLQKNGIYPPGTETLNASVLKNFKITDRTLLQLRLNAFDALNHENLGGLDTDPSSGTFGQLQSAANRTVQIGGKIVF
ncbi:MAG: carboxypeptidase regulatory-like domain-containing protein [Acidobacteriaceae bacterium]